MQPNVHRGKQKLTGLYFYFRIPQMVYQITSCGPTNVPTALWRPA